MYGKQTHAPSITIIQFIVSLTFTGGGADSPIEGKSTTPISVPRDAVPYAGVLKNEIKAKKSKVGESIKALINLANVMPFCFILDHESFWRWHVRPFVCKVIRKSGIPYQGLAFFYVPFPYFA